MDHLLPCTCTIPPAKLCIPVSFILQGIPRANAREHFCTISDKYAGLRAPKWTPEELDAAAEEFCSEHSLPMAAMPVQIFDAFMFNSELDMLEIRLLELYDFVDYFVICKRSSVSITAHQIAATCLRPPAGSSQGAKLSQPCAISSLQPCRPSEGATCEPALDHKCARLHDSEG